MSRARRRRRLRDIGEARIVLEQPHALVDQAPAAVASGTRPALPMWRRAIPFGSVVVVAAALAAAAVWTLRPAPPPLTVARFSMTPLAPWPNTMPGSVHSMPYGLSAAQIDDGGAAVD